MTFRPFLLCALGLALGALGQAAAASYSLRVDAGHHDRSGTPVSFALPDVGQAHWQLTGPDGKPVAIQADDRGLATFIISQLDAFQTAVYQLALAAKPTHDNAVNLVEENGKLRITIGDKTVLHYQAEKSELPRDDLEPVYRRGGYIHPVMTPGGTVITDDYPYVGRCLNGEVSAGATGPDGGPGAGGPGDGPSGPPDLTRVAEALGVTVAELEAALGPPPPDIAGAAATLGVDVEVLRELIGRP